MNIIVTKSAEETKIVAKLFAEMLAQEMTAQGAVVVALDGALGAGKTTFAQGFAEGLGVKEKVKSPTFVLMHKHVLKGTSKKSQVKKYKYFYHADCYRLESEKDVSAIGLDEVMQDPENIVLVEWARRIKKAMPKDTIRVKFSYINGQTRKINFN
ncbi:tRNA (adenosine(37)-N6)-threonylcarbamoyltransferase complex ATPase subunit type 1 TsaE [Candidatus Azambacteria bacterium RBG_16_47_10]|uniref:tRNA threonylcarbamoyladenosine biosynthesis protein TsaE n=1 Tax=Candidatus Azambacteria bacterium RBG_16_47_10 TaxID=1797292 RepID=A0A1F5AYQ2_9BACT|nr:MAG: tRNA (adenosine(37)-N6)-threonylcarbamoyltransferase complex ATPase subunit type 1 TsaE [Candidatus Azambacteria bacterium RBG_16_47_10]